MPTITDATVVAQAYDTSGNGGRKLVKLDSGALVAAVKNTTSQFLYKTNDNWNTKTDIVSYTNYTSSQDVAICTDGKRIFRLYAINNTTLVFNSFDENGTLIQGFNVEPGSQTALGNISLAINEAKTELHAIWASKNSTLSGSFNLRYAKGTINADGTVSWGVVEQWTKGDTSTYYFINPTITVLPNGKPLVVAQSLLNSAYQIIAFGDDLPGTHSLFTKKYKVIYDGTFNYTQSNPSAIFVPQSINGLANGRIWVAWHGTDSTNTTHESIKVSYSDDLGVTWSTTQSVANDPTYYYKYPTITANNKNEIFIVFTSITVGQGLLSIKNSNGVWGSLNTIGNENATTYPNSIYDTSLNFSEPLFIFQNSSKVGFYGAWTTSSISPTQGDRGIITNRQSMMTYAITSDGTIGTVTEKINGVTVGNKTLTSGQNTTISITQAQWDNIKYGKYKDVNANRNTITIEAQGNTYTYTFDKEPTSSSDIISQAKAVKDSAEVSIPAEKKKLSDSINNLGGATTPTNTLSQLSTALSTLNVSKQKTGTTVSSSSVKAFANGTGSANNSYYISLDISVIEFSPNIIFAWRSDKSSQYNTTYFKDAYYKVGSNFADSSVVTNTSATNLQSEISNNLLSLPVVGGNANYSWIAIG